MEQRCQNPHPDFPKEECGAVQEVNICGDHGDGMVSVRCRRCGGWVDFQFYAPAGTEAEVDKALVRM